MTTPSPCKATTISRQTRVFDIPNTMFDIPNTSRGPDETIAIGRQIAAQVRTGDVIALHGELGAGKTCLVKGLAQGLGVTQEVTSPTYTLIHEYHGRVPLYHVDLYRLDSLPQALVIGIEDYLPAADGVTVIEWAEKIADLLPPGTIQVRLEIVDDTTRRIEVAI